MSRNFLVAVLGMLVFLVVAGAVYLEIATSAGASDQVWQVTRAVSAGDVLTSDAVQRTRIPHAGDGLPYFTGKLDKNTRAAHDMATGTILFSNDVLQQDLALVNLTLKASPTLVHGETIDVYVQVGSQTTIVGRRLVVDNASNNACAVWVPASDEPHWITLQASNVSLFAARSTGVGVPQTRPESMSDAIAALSGGSATAPLTLPSPTPSRKP